MPTNQQNTRPNSQGGNRPSDSERDRKAMSDTDRGQQQGKTGLGRDQDNDRGRADNVQTGGDRKR